jgi:hypothetical protein
LPGLSETGRIVMLILLLVEDYYIRKFKYLGTEGSLQD